MTDTYKELALTKNLVRAYFLAKYAIKYNLMLDDNDITKISVSKRGIYFSFRKSGENLGEKYDQLGKYLGQGKDLLPCNSLQTLRHNFEQMFHLNAQDVLDEIKLDIERFVKKHDPYFTTLEQMLSILEMEVTFINKDLRNKTTGEFTNG